MARGKTTHKLPRGRRATQRVLRAEEEMDPALSGREPDADRNDSPDPMDPTGNEVENGPEVDPSDPNLSAALAETGAQEDRASLGKREEGMMELDDPEEEER